MEYFFTQNMILIHELYIHEIYPYMKYIYIWNVSIHDIRHENIDKKSGDLSDLELCKILQIGEDLNRNTKQHLQERKER